MRFGLSEEQFHEIVTFISRYPQIEKAVLFGSRTMGTFREASDVDIAIFGEKADCMLAAKLKYEIEEDTFLPYFFDVVSYQDITNDALKKNIDTTGVEIFNRVNGKN